MMNKRYFREFYSEIRSNISDDERKSINNRISQNFIESDFLKDFNLFLIYISVNNEIDTSEIISFLFKIGKKVAVPYCYGKNMDFYYISSTEELVKGKFGIPSVDINSAVKVENFDDSLCIVPGLSFDNNGNRLGYGGGFYDRFLMGKNLATLGLCYEKCISEELPTEDFDIAMDFVLTETCLRNHKNKEVSTYG